MESLEKALLCLKIVKERKAVDPLLFEVGNLTDLSDYFIIAGGNSSRPCRGIQRAIL